MRARFVGGSQDGKVRADSAGAEYFIVPLPRAQIMNAAEAVRLLSMHWEDRPSPSMRPDVEFYKRSVERDDVSGRPLGFVYTYERTERR